MYSLLGMKSLPCYLHCGGSQYSHYHFMHCDQLWHKTKYFQNHDCLNQIGVFSKVVSSLGLDFVQKSLRITSECPSNVPNLEREQPDVRNVDNEMVEIGDQNRDILSPYQADDYKELCPKCGTRKFPKIMAVHLATHIIADPKVLRHLESILVDPAVGLYLVKK